MGGLLFDGFGIDEAAEVCVYPQFDSSGGADSERTFIKQLVQKYVSDGSDENLFNEEEIKEAYACFDTEDFKTGYQAFLKKKKPNFKGR